ncbi:MAG TPA: nuclear transport factor 2 family protein [Bacteroidales bacterium]|nr:nuclear transport factor 2 family protein [Bacteroidales bacterium]
MNTTKYQQIVVDYINAYNSFDIDNMLKDMHENIRFENISNGEVTLFVTGVKELRKQALLGVDYFNERMQRITHLQCKDNQVEIDVDYSAVLAVDSPNGYKAGDKLELKGKSLFTFEDCKIIALKDFS